MTQQEINRETHDISDSIEALITSMEKSEPSKWHSHKSENKRTLRLLKIAKLIINET